MPAAIPIIATVAAGAAASYQYYGIAMAITVAAQVATQALTKKPSLGSYRDTSERKQVLRAAAQRQNGLFMVTPRQREHCSFQRRVGATG
ncbi:hypothetical protein [Citrobacter youngae]|uniref:hypothetical protein n=1 Tax=Citrobacter youngae TaxID=133448 RepID=UPI000E18E99F|nr:hypothetical protein [Citrobacter youngae]STA85023.1 Uncharacterised protein [Citrobacter youngae]